MNCLSEKNGSECCISIYSKFEVDNSITQVLKRDFTDCSTFLVNQPSFLCPSKTLYYYGNAQVSLSVIFAVQIS